MHNLETPVWANDGKQVRYMGRPVRGADPKTFEVLLGNYARDAHSVYFHSIKSQKIDRATFRVLNANFGVDSSQAYFVVSPIKDSDPKTFRVLDSSLVAESSGNFLQAGFAADATSVWFASGEGIFRIKTADPKTFVSLGNRFSYDHERVYFERGMLPGVDRVTWRPWRDNLSVDKASVYFTNKRVADVDRASIRLLTAHGCFMDRYRIYCGASPVTVEWYLEHMLGNDDCYCTRVREYFRDSKMFDGQLNEWPLVV